MLMNSFYAPLLKNDLVEQFKGKEKIGILLEAIGAQLDEVRDFYISILNGKSLSAAVGRQLDFIGDIVNLSRQDAFVMTGGNIDYSEDENYRNALKYKIVKNTTRCSYEDLHYTSELLYGTDPFIMSEDNSEPAMIHAVIDAYAGVTENVLTYPIIHAGGVGIHFESEKKDRLNLVTKVGVFVSTICAVSCSGVEV